MKMMVLTAAVFPSKEDARKKLWIFLRSCEKYDVIPHLYGVGRIFPGYRAMKLDLQLEYLARAAADDPSYTHVLYTDSWDAFFTASFNKVLGKYEAMGKPKILAAASHQLANVPEEDKQYPNCFDHSIRYCYPHVSGYIAEIPSILDAFQKMLKLPRQTGDDCFNWFDAWQEGWYRPELDSRCEIFQVNDQDTAVEEVPGAGPTLRNTYTGTYPCILHLSGGFTDQVTGKDHVMVPWAKKLGVL